MVRNNMCIVYDIFRAKMRRVFFTQRRKGFRKDAKVFMQSRKVLNINILRLCVKTFASWREKNLT